MGCIKHFVHSTQPKKLNITKLNISYKTIIKSVRYPTQCVVVGRLRGDISCRTTSLEPMSHITPEQFVRLLLRNVWNNTFLATFLISVHTHPIFYYHRKRSYKNFLTDWFIDVASQTLQPGLQYGFYRLHRCVHAHQLFSEPSRMTYVPSLSSGMTVWQRARSLKNMCTCGLPIFTASQSRLS